MTFILKFRNTIISVSSGNYFQIQTVYNHLNNNNIDINYNFKKRNNSQI